MDRRVNPKAKSGALSGSKQLKEISLLHPWRDVWAPPVPTQERMSMGKRMRQDCSRTSHGQWKPADNRPDPLDLLAIQNQSRVEHLIPLRFGRMMQSPFAFYRGAAQIFASDLRNVPRSKAIVQLCGDCHLSNFGIFATPERNVIFDLNDFDETLPGPFEWDLKRLTASFVIAAEDLDFSKSVGTRCVESIVRVYKSKMEQFSEMQTLDVWYQRVDCDELISKISKPGRRQTAAARLDKLKEKRTHAAAVSKFTELVNGKRRIKDDPPLIYHSEEATGDKVISTMQSYLDSLWHSRRRLIQRYHVLDIAAKVVGVGSVGTTAGIVLLQGEGGDDDLIFLQIKEAQRSVLEPYIGRSQFEHPGQRIVSGQRLLQSASDMFLGWATGPKRTFYFRQLMDSKISVPVDELDAVSFVQYAEVCATVLARAHARSGDPAVLYGYLGSNDAFEESMVKFAFAYAKQNEKDYAALLSAIKQGKVRAAE